MSLASRRAYSWLNATSIAAGLGCALAFDLKRSEAAWWWKAKHLIWGQGQAEAGQKALWWCFPQERSQGEKHWQKWGPDREWKQRSRHPKLHTESHFILWVKFLSVVALAAFWVGELTGLEFQTCMKWGHHICSSPFPHVICPISFPFFFFFKSQDGSPFVHYRKIKFLGEDWRILCTFMAVFEARGFKTSDTNLIQGAGVESEEEAAPFSMLCS